jgi:ATP/ADP translocase
MITAPKSGAEVIPFIKTYVNLPTAIVSQNLLNM